MDFDRLPNEIRLKIFMHLPFKDRVRLARVSKGFQELSTMAVSQTTVFDVTADISENLDEESVERLIKLFAGNLRRVVQSRVKEPQVLRKRVTMLSQCPCPRLEKLDLGIAMVANATLRNLLGKCPNLRSFKCTYPNDTFPSGVVCEKVEEVDISSCTAKFFELLVQSCPNLKHLVLEFDWKEQPKQWEQLLNKIFAAKPELEMLKLKYRTKRIRIDKMENLWSLVRLRSLSLQCGEIRDETMIQISKSFGQLECLRLELFDQLDRKVPCRRGIEALSNLKHLRELAVLRNRYGMFQYGTFRYDIDRGARRLVECGRLRVVRFSDPLNPRTMRAFVQRCPMLRRLSVWSVEGVETSDEAKYFVESLSSFVQKHLEIALTCDDNRRHIWLSKEVKEAVDRVNAVANGRSITILIKRPWNDPDGEDYINIGPSMYKRTAEAWIEWSKWDEEEKRWRELFEDDASIS